jgi:hypothetical protein
LTARNALVIATEIFPVQNQPLHHYGESPETGCNRYWSPMVFPAIPALRSGRMMGMWSFQLKSALSLLNSSDSNGFQPENRTEGLIDQRLGTTDCKRGKAAKIPDI